MIYIILSITIPDTVKDRVINSICGNFDYQATLEDGSVNPQTKTQFAKQEIISFIKTIVKNYERDIAMDTAAEQSDSSVEKDIVLS